MSRSDRSGVGRPGGRDVRLAMLPIALFVSVVAGVARTDAIASGTPAAGSHVDVPRVPASLPVRAEHRYRMLGRVRPLLFWISRDDIGGARITWREASDGVGYELLIGSDPRRAPQQINRWGYIVEEVRGSEAQVLGVMKQSNETSLEEAQSRIARERNQRGYVFKAIRGTTNGRDSEARVVTVRSERDLTYRDVDPLMTLVAAAGQDGRIRQVAMPAGAQPGFLTALAELIHRSVEDRQRQSATTRSVPYAYNGSLHDLTLRRSKAVSSFDTGRHRYDDVIQAGFESKNRTTGLITDFQLVYGTTGRLAEVPVHAVYQPRWWLEVQLFLDDSADF